MQMTATDKYDGWLDRNFDNALSALDLDWLPWIGSSFSGSHSRTIILGESVYDYGKSKSAKDIIQKPESLRLRHMAHAILRTRKVRYLGNLERAVFLKSKPSLAERRQLWDGVVYHNLVLRMLTSRRSRPTSADYERGWRSFLAMAECLQARRCIAYGLEIRKIDALLAVLPRGAFLQSTRLPAVRLHEPLLMKLQLSSGPMELLFVRHPSAFFAWKEWGLAMRAAGFAVAAGGAETGAVASSGKEAETK